MTDLISLIEKHLEDTDTAPAAFGREVMNDPNFVFDLRNGRDYRASTERRIREKIKTAQGEQQGAAQ